MSNRFQERSTLQKLMIAGLMLIFVIIPAHALFAEDAQTPVTKLAINLVDYMDKMEADDFVKALVIMEDRADLTDERSLATRHARNVSVVTKLKQKALDTQGPVLEFIADLKELGVVKSYRSFWITNMIAVEGTPEAITKISQLAEIEIVGPDYDIELIAPTEITPAPPEQPGQAESRIG